MISYNGVEVVTHKEVFQDGERMALVGLFTGEKVTLTHKEWSDISGVEHMEEEKVEAVEVATPVEEAVAEAVEVSE